MPEQGLPAYWGVRLETVRFYFIRLWRFAENAQFHTGNLASHLGRKDVESVKMQATAGKRSFHVLVKRA